MINRIIDDINKALEAEAYMAALSLVLTLPDICAKAEYGDSLRNKERYIKWYDENIGQYEKAPIEPGETEMPYLSGEVVYQLRCSMLHQGTPNVDKENIKNEQCQIDHFTLVIEKKKPFDIYLDCSSMSNWISPKSSKPYRSYQVNIRRLCLIITRTTKGFIYILTNPSFPQYVKIGYATDVQQRLDELNRSTAVPFAFRVYATYEVDSALSDKKLHSILDKLNPELRSTEEVEGKRRIREFYAMPPEDAYAILEAIAEINDYRHRLKKWKATATEQREEALAQEINEQHQERMAPFTFSMCNIAVGEQIEFCCTGNEHSGELFEVADDKHVTYNGERWSLTALAKYLLNVKWSMAGPKYFKYKGEWLNDIRRKLTYNNL